MFSYFIEKAIKKLDAGRMRTDSDSLPVYDDLQTFVILFNVIDVRHIQKAKTSLIKDGKQVILWGVDHTKISMGHSQSTVIDTSQISFLGFPSKELLNEYKKIEADVVIDMTREYSSVLTYLMVSNKNIPYRIGFHDKEREKTLYDHICDISSDEHVDLLFKNLMSFFKEHKDNWEQETQNKDI